MRHCYVVRVFTMGTGGGNHLGVIPDSTGLSASDMQAIATDLGFSETVFMKWRKPADPRLRIFTPAVELPFAGHPLVGTAWVLNEMGPGAERMSIAIGTVGIRIDRSVVWVSVPEHDRPVEELDVAAVTEGLGFTGIRAWRVEVPSKYLVVELASAADLVAVEPDIEAVAVATEGLYLVAGDDPVRSRFFAPRLGVDEDPATGSAAVAYAAVKRALGIESGSGQIVQGVPDALSEIRLVWDGSTVELGGRVVKDEVRVLDV